MGEPIVIRAPRKMRRATKVQDAHSMGEQALYDALWNAAAPETAESRLIRIGYGGMQGLCGLDRTNCKKNLLSLVRKLALEIVADFDVRRNEGKTYRIFSPEVVLRRRSTAGLHWVVRNRGVAFVSESQAGDSPIGD